MQDKIGDDFDRYVLLRMTLRQTELALGRNEGVEYTRQTDLLAGFTQATEALLLRRPDLMAARNEMISRNWAPPKPR